MTRTGVWQRVGLAVALTFGLAVALAGPLLAADATATPGTGGGDPRSPGQGPGLVGDPGFALGAVLVVAILSVVLTLAWVRIAGTAGETPRR